MKKILYVDDEANNLIVFETVFKRYYEVYTVSSVKEARKLLTDHTFDVILSDQKMPDETGVDLFAETLNLYPSTERIIITGYTDIEAISQAVNAGGIFYYVTKPWEANDLRLVIDRAIEKRTLKLNVERLVNELQDANRQLTDKNSYLEEANQEIKNLKNKLENENQALKKEISKSGSSGEIVFGSKAYKQVMSDLYKVAPTNSTVLILGETGTGKELLARAVHHNSLRKDKAFIKVNCAAIPANLIESELFGHLKGSFTGAINNKMGFFELADKGTIFLDEIGEMPLELQPKLLRVLQEGEFNRIGDSKTIKVDVRIVAATNRNLIKAVKDGSFRSDLYFRLNVFPITNLKLSERKEDIPMLVEHFVKKHSKRIGKEIKSIDPEALNALTSYDWPGNIRELENYVERAIILSTNGILDAKNWTKTFFNDPDKKESNELVELRDVEKRYILKVLELTDWKLTGNKSATEVLGIKTSTLVSKMKKHGIPTKKSMKT